MKQYINFSWILGIFSIPLQVTIEPDNHEEINFEQNPFRIIKYIIRMIHCAILSLIGPIVIEKIEKQLDFI